MNSQYDSSRRVYATPPRTPISQPNSFTDISNLEERNQVVNSQDRNFTLKHFVGEPQINRQPIHNKLRTAQDRAWINCANLPRNTPESSPMINQIIENKTPTSNWSVNASIQSPKLIAQSALQRQISSPILPDFLKFAENKRVNTHVLTNVQLNTRKSVQMEISPIQDRNRYLSPQSYQYQSTAQSTPQKQELNFDYVTTLALIGKGTYSSIYRVMEQMTGNIYAFKTFQKSHVPREIFGLLHDEINIQQNLNHPNILKLYGVKDDGIYFSLILEDAEYSLDKLLSEQNLNEQQIIHISAQLLSGLVYIHNQGIIHRDIKPDNILINNWQIKIADFGISVRSSSSNQFCGTPGYMAPEVENLMIYDQKADCYSMGRVIRELGNCRKLQQVIDRLCQPNPQFRCTAFEALMMLQ